MNKILILLLTINFLIGFSSPAFAWDDAGHKVTAYIAWQRMDPDVRERVFKILMSAPEDSDLNVFYNAFDSRNDETRRLELFMTAATWADMIKNTAFKVRAENYNKPNWHYADIFWKQIAGKPEILKDFPEETGKAIPKLYDFEKILRDETATDSEKAIALAWFLHVGGDIHNPLHNASRVTETEPKGDQGGNMFLLTPKDAPRRTNLHSYWDSLITSNMPRENDLCDSGYIPNVAEKIMKKHRYTDFNSRIKTGDYKEWNLEGYAYLNSTVYSADVKRGEAPGKIYREAAFSLGMEQLALAGYRLGDTLNLIFGKVPDKVSLETVEGCTIIRNIPYPVRKRRSADQVNRIAVLDICPPNQGMAARPIITTVNKGISRQHEFDVLKVFDTENEAKLYAKENGITDARYNK